MPHYQGQASLILLTGLLHTANTVPFQFIARICGDCTIISAEEHMSDKKVYAAIDQRGEPRPKFARLSPNHPLAVKQMAARIKSLIEFFSEDGKS